MDDVRNRSASVTDRRRRPARPRKRGPLPYIIAEGSNLPNRTLRRHVLEARNNVRTLKLTQPARTPLREKDNQPEAATRQLD